MSRIFCRISSYFLRRSRKLSSFYRIRQVVTGASLFSLALSSGHLVLPFDQKSENAGKLLSVGPNFDQQNQVSSAKCSYRSACSCASISKIRLHWDQWWSFHDAQGFYWLCYRRSATTKYPTSRYWSSNGGTAFVKYPPCLLKLRCLISQSRSKWTDFLLRVPVFVVRTIQLAVFFCTQFSSF